MNMHPLSSTDFTKANEEHKGEAGLPKSTLWNFIKEVLTQNQVKGEKNIYPLRSFNSKSSKRRKKYISFNRQNILNIHKLPFITWISNLFKKWKKNIKYRTYSRST